MRLGVVLDLDGTLVDSVYHHVLVWDQVLVEHGYEVPLENIHQGIGIGGSRLIAWLLGGAPPDLGQLTEEHDERFVELRDRLRPTVGALGLLADLERRGVPTAIATSAGSTVRAALLETLGDPQLPTTDSDAIDDSKPAADLLLAACEQIDIEPANAVLVGDSPWDVAAARRVGMQMIAVRTGGFGDAALTERGPTTIVDAPADLIATL